MSCAADESILLASVTHTSGGQRAFLFRESPSTKSPTVDFMQNYLIHSIEDSPTHANTAVSYVPWNHGKCIDDVLFAEFLQNTMSLDDKPVPRPCVSGGERTYVPRYRCSPNLCSPVPMFPGTDVPRFLYFNSGH